MEHPADPWWKDHTQMLTRGLTSLLLARHLKGRMHLSCICSPDQQPALTCKCAKEKVSKGLSTKGLQEKGGGIQLNVKSRNEPQVFQAERLAAWEMILIYTCKNWCQTRRWWDGWAQRSEVSTSGFFKDGNSRGPSIQVTKGRRVIVLHAFSLTHIQKDLQLLCQFGSSLPLTHNPATRSFLSKGLSMHPTSFIKEMLWSQIIPPNLSVHVMRRSGCLCSLCSQWRKRWVSPGGDWSFPNKGA